MAGSLPSSLLAVPARMFEEVWRTCDNNVTLVSEPNDVSVTLLSYTTTT
jgi:hypothetical protein